MARPHVKCKSANCTIVCGVTIGEYALIGAGSVVTKDVKAHAVVIGVPAKQTGWVSHAGEIMKGELICPLENRKYVVNDNGWLIEKI
jgi:UDP-2-acetamido-3-amino-2,3-dideoxy-glucuronate N-acetyltransferase